MNMDTSFWKHKRVLVTGHTGFKGAWLCQWLSAMGAEVTGFALDPPTQPSLFELCGVDKLVNSVIADVRDYSKLSDVMGMAKPEIVIHMAAQPLVRESYKNPVETYSINVMGTVNLLEAIRKAQSIRAMVNVTTDKCYENKEWIWGYRENERLGGYDPYSNSKACSELVTVAYQSSFFHPENYISHGVAVASARAGNVIGGGDWAKDRLVPDCIRSILNGEKVFIRHPHAIRPWQHVLEPLCGYLMLAHRLYTEGSCFAEGWNFGPSEDDAVTVEMVVKQLCESYGCGASYDVDRGDHPHEARFLMLDCSKAKARLGWRPRWNVKEAIDQVVVWTKAYKEKADLRSVCMAQIDRYLSS